MGMRTRYLARWMEERDATRSLLDQHSDWLSGFRQQVRWTLPLGPS